MGPAGRRMLLCGWAGVIVVGTGRGQVAPQLGRTQTAHVARAQRFLQGRNAIHPSTTGTVTAAEMLAMARVQHAAMTVEPRATSLGTAWTPVGPGQVVSATYGAVTGRVTAVAIDPSDATGNTIYVGTTGGGVWKSTNAAGPATAVSFAPLTDTLPVFSANAGSSATASLSIGALGVGNGVLLAGTGDPNDASDSYYGSGLLRSTDGGVTWTLVQGSKDGVAGNHSFFGLSFAGFAFSSSNPSLIVAAVGQAAEGTLVNAPDLTNSVQGLYFSTDAGVTWQMASIYDGSQPVQIPLASGANHSGNAATSVVWNPLRQRFYAAVRFHGYYESADGQTWMRLARQPGTGLTTAACPTDPGTTGSVNCPIFRGALAVQPGTGDTFALTVDGANLDQGLWQDACLAVGSACGSSTILFGTRLGGAAGVSPLDTGGGVIQQGDYNLSLTTAASGTDTVVYVGTIDLFRCSLAGGCVLRNTTNAQNGCTNPAGVAAAQHAIATLSTSGGPLVYMGNDGGIYRSSDGANETGAACSAGDAGHFQNLNPGMGSLAEVVSFAQDPVNTSTLVVGLGALGTAGTGTVSAPWPQLATGEGGTVAIDAATPANWYVSTGAGVSIARCTKGAACVAADFAGIPVIAAAQVAEDASAIDAPWILDPALSSDVLIGTCRAWRGLATGVGWPGANTLSRPFGSTTATSCGSSAPAVRSLAAGGAVSVSGAPQNQGAQVLYAGLAGTLNSGGAYGGHVFATALANLANASTAWKDVSLGTVTNDTIDSGLFNPGGFDVSSVAVDPHDVTGATVYVTVMGFAGNGTNAPHVYRSTDGGGHWTNISSNLPNAPANSVVVDPNDANTVYVAMDTGVYVTTGVTGCAGGNCWSVYGTALPNAPVVELQAAVGMATGDGRTGELRAATYGRGIWQIPLVAAVSPTAPAMTVSPTSLTFASQQVGTTSAAQSVTVTNTGTAPLTVSTATASGDFNQTNTCTGAAIAPAAACTVQVTFLPSAAGGRTGTLTVFGNVPGGQATVTLNGTATAAAAIVLTPVSLTFASQQTGTTSAVQNITISNTGGNPATLTSEAVSGDFTITQNTCGAGLGPQSGCTISVAFTPTAAGARTGALTVTDSAGTQTASLSGTGTAAATDGLSPLSLTFAAQALNTASVTQTVTLINNGDVALTLIAAKITSGDFTVVNGCGNSLNGHASCALSVAFVPKALGMQSGTLTVSDQFRMQTVVLNGTGVAPAGVSLAPVSGLSFGATALGQTAATLTVTLTNNGGQTLAVSSVMVSGDFFVVANACGSTVAVGGACTVGIGFRPTVAGARGGTLTVVSNAAGSPQTLALAGIGVDFTLTADGPTSATVTSGQTASYLLLVNSAAGVVGNVALTCSGMPANAVCTMNPSSAGLGGSTVITVTMATGVAVGASTMATGKMVWVGLLPLCLFGLMGRRRLRGGAIAVLVGVGILGVGGCGTARLIPAQTGGGGTTVTAPTPSGTYAVTVAGSSAGLVKSVGLTLVVK